MSDFVKNLWAIFLASLTFGIWTFPIIVVLMILALYIERRKSRA
jgi:ABC-type Fe3+ transport system permease subunit